METKVYQPYIYQDDGTNIGWNLPDGLFSWQVFSSEDEAEWWLVENGYDPDDCVIEDYDEEDIEDLQIIDRYGDRV